MENPSTKVIPKYFFTTENNVFTFRYEWTITNFSFVQEKIKSSVFSSGLPGFGDEWYLELYPRRLSISRQEEVLTIILKFQSQQENLRVPTQFKILVMNSSRKEINIQQTTNPFLFHQENNKNSHDFMTRNNLLDVSKEYFPDDVLIVLCEVRIMVNDYVENTSNELRVDDGQLKEYLSHILSCDKFNDVTVKVKGKSFGAIKGLLARSPVFCAMFEHAGFKENENNEIIIDDVEENVFEEFLKFIYTNEAPNISKMPKSLLAVAEKYQVDSLKNWCEEILIKSIDIYNVIELFIFGDTHNSSRLRSTALNYIKTHHVEVVITNGFAKLVESHKNLFTEVRDAIKDILFIQSFRSKTI